MSTSDLRNVLRLIIAPLWIVCLLFNKSRTITICNFSISKNDILISLIRRCNCVIYTYEDIELRRLFPSEFPQDTIRKSGSLDPEHLGRYAELKRYFKYPKDKLNSHFEELVCYDKDDRKVCKIDAERYSPEEDAYYWSPIFNSHVDRRRVYCFMLLCFTEDELDRVVASF